jgi:hypothetical protein
MKPRKLSFDLTWTVAVLGAILMLHTAVAGRHT